MSVIYTAPTIDFEELTAPTTSPSESNDRSSGFKATRTLRCAWADRLTLMDQLLRAYAITGSTGNFFRGDFYPHRDKVYVTNISGIKAHGRSGPGSSNKIASWTMADLTVQYEQLSFDPDGGDSSDSSDPSQFNVWEESVNYSAEFITLPDVTLYWDNAQNAKVENVEAPALTIPNMEWTLSGTLATPLPGGIVSMVGRVNDAQIKTTSLGLTFAAETLLYTGAQIQREVGDGAVDLSLAFIYKPTGWNRFFKSGEQDPQQLFTRTGAAYDPFQTADFVGQLDIGL